MGYFFQKKQKAPIKARIPVKKLLKGRMNDEIDEKEAWLTKQRIICDFRSVFFIFQGNNYFK